MPGLEITQEERMKVFVFVALLSVVSGLMGVRSGVRSSVSIGLTSASSSAVFAPFAAMVDKEPEKEGLERLQEQLRMADEMGDKSKPPLYDPGPYTLQALSALAYVVPIVDAADLGKYMFEAYPEVATAYTTVFGPLSAIYNGVPFLPFAVFFLLSYICRAPSFPVEVRFHVAQAFMLSIIQFIPSFGLGLLEKSGVPGMAVLYNFAFTWVLGSCFFMQATLLNPVSSSKNPVLINVVGWALKYMGYAPDPTMKR